MALFGKSTTVAYRMTSLLPREWGAGTRNNNKREYIFDHLSCIYYRTIIRANEREAKEIERQLMTNRSTYRFPT